MGRFSPWPWCILEVSLEIRMSSICVCQREISRISWFNSFSFYVRLWDDFSKSCWERMRAFLLAAWAVFVEEEEGCCVFVCEEGFCQDIALLSTSQRKRVRERERSSATLVSPIPHQDSWCHRQWGQIIQSIVHMHFLSAMYSLGSLFTFSHWNLL